MGPLKKKADVRNVGLLFDVTAIERLPFISGEKPILFEIQTETFRNRYFQSGPEGDVPT